MYYSKISEDFSQFLTELKGSKVAVLGHMRPDGDCIGSQVALCRILNQAGIEAIAVNRDPATRVLAPFIEDTPWAQADAIDLSGYTSINVDCADEIRVSQFLLDLFPETFLNIDHHISNKAYAQHNIIIPEASATAEILAGLFIDNGLKIDRVTAQALYVGIATDTGQFRFPSTSPQVFAICSELIECGANPGKIAEILYENESFNKLELLQRFLASLTMEFSGRVCIGKLTNEDYLQTGALREDSEGLVDYARAIKGVDIGVMIEERADDLKCSFRAKEPKYRVDQMAQVFGGGGHACAAGLNQTGMDINVFSAKLIEIIAEKLKQVDAEEV